VSLCERERKRERKREREINSLIVWKRNTIIEFERDRDYRRGTEKRNVDRVIIEQKEISK
jgi:hypothetical protein